MTSIVLSNRANNVKLFLRNLRGLSRIVKSKDYFGIDHVTSKDISAAFKSTTKLDQKDIHRYYEPLIGPRDAAVNDEDEIDCDFGRMRLDESNLPKTHGQFEPQHDKPIYDEDDMIAEYMKDEIESHRGRVDTDMTKRAQSDIEQELEALNTPSIKMNPAYKISEVEPIIQFEEVIQMFRKERSSLMEKYNNKPPLLFSFEEKSSTSDQARTEKIESHELRGHKIEGKDLEQEIITSIHTLQNKNFIDKKPPLIYDVKQDKVPLHELDPRDPDYHERHDEELEKQKFAKDIEARFEVSHEPEKEQSAFIHLKKVERKQVEPIVKRLSKKVKSNNLNPSRPQTGLDSKGFKVYGGQVPNWTAMRRVDILKTLEDNIAYHNYDILVLNKPYGLAAHCDDHKSDEGLNVNDLMQEVAGKLKLDKLYLVHRLDKTTTGALMFATNGQKASTLSKLLKADLIKKTYWCITAGVPDPSSAVIDIPIGEYEVAGKRRSCVAPEGMPRERQFDKRYKEARRAVTEYNVIKATKHAALVEVKPRSGVKHQIRCHLSQGIGRPILGDHKYSHFTRVAPQKLSDPLLRALQLRQSKVRTLPMHLHARSLIIPGAKSNGETLFVNVPVPPFFKENLKALKLWKDDLKC